MSRKEPSSRDLIESDLIRRLATPNVDADKLLSERGLWTPQTAHRLAEEALDCADSDRETATAWLALATRILDDCDRASVSETTDERALVHYVRARLCVQSGEVVQAEAALRYAQELWQRSGNSAWLARSNLGLSQVLTVQGRYAEAETAIRSAIDWLSQTDMPETPKLQALATAHRNLANVLMFQERHGSALEAYGSAEGYLVALASSPEKTELGDRGISEELAHLALNRANALTFLDRPVEAESALLRAIELFDESGDALNRGRAHTNLGRLYLREGRYATALDRFDRSARDLIGEMPVDSVFRCATPAPGG